MKQDTVITTLINLTEDQILKVERELAQISHLKLLEEKKVEELQKAAQEFSHTLNQKLSKGCSMQDYQSQNLMLNNFYLNIEQIEENIANLKKQHCLLMESWQDHYKRNMQFNILGKRQEYIYNINENKREQKSLDEHSLRAFISQNKK